MRYFFQHGDVTVNERWNSPANSIYTRCIEFRAMLLYRNSLILFVSSGLNPYVYIYIIFTVNTITNWGSSSREKKDIRKGTSNCTNLLGFFSVWVDINGALRSRLVYCISIAISDVAPGQGLPYVCVYMYICRGIAGMAECSKNSHGICRFHDPKI